MYARRGVYARRGEMKLPRVYPRRACLGVKGLRLPKYKGRLVIVVILIASRGKRRRKFNKPPQFDHTHARAHLAPGRLSWDLARSRVFGQTTVPLALQDFICPPREAEEILFICINVNSLLETATARRLADIHLQCYNATITTREKYCCRCHGS